MGVAVPRCQSQRDFGYAGINPMMPQLKGFWISRNQSHDARVGGILDIPGSPLKIRVEVSTINMYKPPGIF